MQMELTELQFGSVLKEFNSAGVRGVIFYPLTCTSIFTYRICATLGGFYEMSIHLYQTSWRHNPHVMHWTTSRYHMAIYYIYNIKLSLNYLWISSFLPSFLSFFIYVFLLLFVSLISNSHFDFTSPFFFTLFVSFLCSFTLLACICIVFI